MKKVLLTGSSGLVGSRLVELLKDRYQLLTPNEKEFNLLDQSSLKKYLDKHQPDYLFNLAAFTDVNAAEQQTGDKHGLCWQLNVDGLESLIKSLPKSTHLFHISTDMVFSGSVKDPGPYAENHPLPQSSEQLTWYGWTKNRGEQFALNAGHSIIRIIYPIRLRFADKADYLRGILNKYAQGKLHPLFSDQLISITFIDHLAEVISAIIDKNLSGIFHACSSDTTNPYQLAKYALKQLGQDTSVVKRSSLKDYLKTLDNPYRYPLVGGLQTNKSAQLTGLTYPTWQEIIDQLISQGLSL